MQLSFKEELNGRLKKILNKILGWNLRRNYCTNIACTGFYRIIVGIVLVCIGAWAGNYFQPNKDFVKNKLKEFVDKM